MKFASYTLAGLAFLMGTSDALAQCGSGGMTLAVNGDPQLGGGVTLGLDGTPGNLVFLLVDANAGPLPTAWGNLCVGAGFAFLVNGTASPFLAIPPTGKFLLPLGIPDVPALAGKTFHFQGATLDPGAPLPWAVALSNGVAITITAAQPVTTIYLENFENGPGLWIADNGVWQVGIPSVGPTASWSGVHCAATNLTGNYPSSGANTHLISPVIALPATVGAEQLRVAFRMWFSSEDVRDLCTLRVREVLGGPGPWQDLTPPASGWSQVWTQFSADLTGFAGKAVQLGFRLQTSDKCCPTFAVSGAGFYIDDVHIYRGAPFLNAPEQWEGGIGPWWHSDNGLWEVGVPAAANGPPSAPSGVSVAGTVMAGNYPSNGADTRLISPPLSIPITPFPQLFFQHWFNTEVNRDLCRVQVSADGTAWTTVGNAYSGNSSGWTQAAADLTPWAGKTVLVGFYFTSSDACCPTFQVSGPGWFIDDVILVP